MFFSKIYKSWKGIQQEKYKAIMENIGSSVFDELVRGRVLDVGSGSGFFETFLERRGFGLGEWVCLDPDPDMLRGGGFSRMLGDGNRLPFRPGSFDSLVCLDSIHLIQGDVFWALRPGGLALVSLFSNPGNLEGKRRVLMERMEGMEIVKEFLAKGKEGEIFILARKR
jgi:SAM-dependent methyltransferase